MLSAPCWTYDLLNAAGGYLDEEDKGVSVRVGGALVHSVVHNKELMIRMWMEIYLKHVSRFKRAR